MFSFDQYKAYWGRDDDPGHAPSFGALYVVVGAVLLATFVVNRLGWTWVAGVVFVAVVVGAISGWVYLRRRKRRKAAELRGAMIEGDRWA